MVELTQNSVGMSDVNQDTVVGSDSALIEFRRIVNTGGVGLWRGAHILLS